MISVTRLDGSVMVVNDDQIAWIETRPDTVISMMNGEKLLVREALETLVERAREFRRSLVARGPLQVARRAAGAAGRRSADHDDGFSGFFASGADAEGDEA
jgi:flagellar protein FlbD